MLICEDIPDIAGLVLPLQDHPNAARVPNPHTLSEIGEALVGWLDLNRSFYTFLDAAPSFEAPSDFRIERLVTMNEVLEAQDETLIVVQRKARPLNLSVPAVETAQRLLAPIYQRIDT